MKKTVPLLLIFQLSLAGFFLSLASTSPTMGEDNDLSSHYEELDKLARKSLHDYFVSCKSFWVKRGGGIVCTLDIALSKEFGFEYPEGVSIKGKGTDDNFEALAYHRRSIRVFRINSEGGIVEVLSL